MDRATKCGITAQLHHALTMAAPGSSVAVVIVDDETGVAFSMSGKAAHFVSTAFAMLDRVIAEGVDETCPAQVAASEAHGVLAEFMTATPDVTPVTVQ